MQNRFDNLICYWKVRNETDMVFWWTKALLSRILHNSFLDTLYILGVPRNPRSSSLAGYLNNKRGVIQGIGLFCGFPLSSLAVGYLNNQPEAECNENAKLESSCLLN